MRAELIVPGGNDRRSLPTLGTETGGSSGTTTLTSLAMGWMRNASTQPAPVVAQLPPPEAIFQTLPIPVVPSPVQRLPSRSKANPFVPGTPVAKLDEFGIFLHNALVDSSEAHPTGSGLTFR